jgi:hypothetical protein
MLWGFFKVTGLEDGGNKRKIHIRQTLNKSWYTFLGFCFVFCSTRVWTQSLMLARQSLYHVSHSVSPKLVYFYADYKNDHLLKPDNDNKLIQRKMCNKLNNPSNVKLGKSDRSKMLLTNLACRGNFNTLSYWMNNQSKLAKTK